MSDNRNRTRRELSRETLLTLTPKQLCQYFAPETQVRVSPTEFWIPSAVQPNFLWSGVGVLNEQIIPIYQKSKKAVEKNLFIKILHTFEFLDEKLGPGTTRRLFALEEIHPQDFLGLTEETENLRLMLLDTYFKVDDDEMSTSSEVSEIFEIENSDPEDMAPLAIENSCQPNGTEKDLVEETANQSKKPVTVIENFIDNGFDIEKAISESIESGPNSSIQSESLHQDEKPLDKKEHILDGQEQGYKYLYQQSRKKLTSI